MIRNRYFQFIFCIGFLAVMASCADKVDVDLSENENTTFTAWMAKNRPDMPEVRPGLYYQIHRAANGDESTRPSYNSWVEITFDGSANCSIEKKAWILSRGIGRKIGRIPAGGFEMGIWPGGAGIGKVEGTEPHLWSFLK